MVFGDNVRARKAARALHTPRHSKTKNEEKRGKEKTEKNRKQEE
jgi:hypothetical protein